MQELIDELDLTKIVDRDKLTMVKYIIDQCLEKEKEQIIDAYYGFIDGIYEYREAGEEYYNQNYNQNK